MLTKEQAFRVGFLARCSEEGLHGAALDERLEAAGVFAKSAGAIADFFSGLGQPLNGAIHAGGVAALAGAGLGAGIGAGLGTLSAPEDPGKIKRPPFLADVQKAELAAALRQQAAELHQLGEARLQAPTPTRSRYGI